MIDHGRNIRIMGILNATPDSYYASSRYAMDVFESGADIVDIGAVSTRPGASEVSMEEEWARLEPVLKAVSGSFVEISVDTTRASIIERTCDLLGRPVIANDISAGEDDASMLATVARLGLTYVAMHKRGTPSTMQSLCDYDDVVEDVLNYFNGFALKASEAGVKDWILDPGFGFAKTVGQNYRLLESLERFASPSRQLLVGISRKSMIYKPLGVSPEEALTATQALHLMALEHGADILRVHDVEAARQTVTLYRLMHGI